MHMLYTLIGWGGNYPKPFLNVGQMSSPVNYKGGRCPHIPFFIGGGGANVRGGKCSTLIDQQLREMRSFNV